MTKSLFAALTIFALNAASGDIADTVAHWSYDSSTLTVVGGNITGVADSTGNHNATVGSGLGSGSFTSNPIPAANSVAGRFGEGLTLTGFNNVAGGGGQFLMYPEITEIMAFNGAPTYTVSMWINTLNTSFNGFTTLSDWGNSNSTPGRFSYAFSFSSATQMRAQSRFDNGTAVGGDIYARAATTPVLNNGAWHMLTWTFDPTTGTLRSYFDASLVDTFTSTAASFQMVTASSLFGSLGLKGDSGNFINGSVTFDEIYVFRGAASDSEIQNLYTLNVVPEPTSFGLAGVGAFLLTIARRRVARRSSVL